MTTESIDFLNDVLVLAVRKGFWASKECEVFPNRIYTRRLMAGPGRWGSSRNPVNVLTAAVAGYIHYLFRGPRLILLWAPRIAGWFSRLKRAGMLPGTKLLAPGALYLDDAQARDIDKLIVFSRGEVALHDPALKDKYVFIPLPADGPFDAIGPTSQGNYIFSGGGAGRDFTTLIESVRDIDVKLTIVTFYPTTLGYTGELPSNCQVYWKMPSREFLELMAGALFVVVPLQKGQHPHGHTTVVQALRLGKAVITTHNASIGDYVADGQAGLLVSPGDVSAYREAILKLLNQPDVRKSCARHAQIKAQELTYEVFQRRLVDLCRDMLRMQPSE
jgi:glycosyltransferase involved in cell wall biosynthesis